MTLSHICLFLPFCSLSPHPCPFPFPPPLLLLSRPPPPPLVVVLRCAARNCFCVAALLPPPPLHFCLLFFFVSASSYSPGVQCAIASSVGESTQTTVWQPSFITPAQHRNQVRAEEQEQKEKQDRQLWVVFSFLHLAHPFFSSSSSGSTHFLHHTCTTQKRGDDDSDDDDDDDEEEEEDPIGFTKTASSLYVVSLSHTLPFRFVRVCLFVCLFFSPRVAVFAGCCLEEEEECLLLPFLSPSIQSHRQEEEEEEEEEQELQDLPFLHQQPTRSCWEVVVWSGLLSLAHHHHLLRCRLLHSRVFILLLLRHPLRVSPFLFLFLHPPRPSPARLLLLRCTILLFLLPLHHHLLIRCHFLCLLLLLHLLILTLELLLPPLLASM